MTCLKSAAGLAALITLGSFVLQAQGPPPGRPTQSPAEWQLKHELALKHLGIAAPPPPFQSAGADI